MVSTLCLSFFLSFFLSFPRVRVRTQMGDVAPIVLELLAASREFHASGEEVLKRTFFGIAAMMNHMTLDECLVVEGQVRRALECAPEHIAQCCISIYFDFAAKRPSLPSTNCQGVMQQFSALSFDTEDFCSNASILCLNPTTDMVLHGEARTTACWGITPETEFCECQEGRFSSLCRQCCEHDLLSFFKGVQNGTAKSCMKPCAVCRKAVCVFRPIPFTLFSEDEELGFPHTPVQNDQANVDDIDFSMFGSDITSDYFNTADFTEQVAQATKEDAVLEVQQALPAHPEPQQEVLLPAPPQDHGLKIRQIRDELETAQKALRFAIASLDKIPSSKVGKNTKTKAPRARKIGKCSICHQPNHNKKTCPVRKKAALSGLDLS